MGPDDQRQKVAGLTKLVRRVASPALTGRALAAALLCSLSLTACSDESETAPPAEERTMLGDGPAADLGDGGPALPVLEIPADAPLVAFLGDSISAGLHLPSDSAFPAVLQRALFERELPFRLINAGVSGDTTSGGLARTNWLLQQSPDVLVLELGANDGLRGIPVETMRDNLRQIIERAHAADCRVLLLGVLIPPSYGDEYAAAVRELYPDLAEEFDLAFVPYFMQGVAGVTELTLPDGLHPTVEGHRLLAANVEDALAAVLAEGLAEGLESR